MAKIMRTLELTHEKLSVQRIFRAWLILSLTSVFLCFFLFYKFQDTGISKNTLDIIRIIVLALAFLSFILAIISNIHRTVQTNHQIKVTESKNKSDFYLSHYKYISEVFSSMKDYSALRNNDVTLNLAITLPRITYRKLYPNNTLREGVVELTPSVGKTATMKLLMSIYSRCLDGVGQKANSFEELPVDFKSHTLNIASQKIRLRVSILFFIMVEFFDGYGIEIYASDNKNQRTNREIDALIDNDWFSSFVFIFNFWINLNRCTESDLSDEDISLAKRSFCAFLEKINDGM